MVNHVLQASWFSQISSLWVIRLALSSNYLNFNSWATILLHRTIFYIFIWVKRLLRVSLTAITKVRSWYNWLSRWMVSWIVLMASYLGWVQLWLLGCLVVLLIHLFTIWILLGSLPLRCWCRAIRLGTFLSRCLYLRKPGDQPILG